MSAAPSTIRLPKRPELDRLPPHNIAVERGLLASVIRDASVLPSVRHVQPHHFYRDLNQRIWAAILKMAASGRKIDAYTVFDAIEPEGVGFEEFDEIIGAVPHSANAVEYASIVMEKARSRELIDAAQRMIDDAYRGISTAADVVNRGMEILAPIADVATGGGFLAINGGEFMSREYPREYIVQRMLVRGRPTILAGPKKSLKTTLGVELVVCMATASDFLGAFPVTRPCRVLLVSAESGEATLQETCRRVCRDKGLDPDRDLGGLFFAFNLPRLDSAADLAALGEFIHANQIDVVVLDPLYLMLITGTSGTEIDAANLFHTGPLLRRIAESCLDAGATPILIHHFKKGRTDPYGMPELDDLAYAGLAEFARQWLLVGRRSAYVSGTGDHELWMVAGGSDGHGGEWAVDLHEGIMGDDFADRDWRVSVRPASLARQEAQEATQDTRAEKQRQKDEAARRRLQEDATAAFDKLCEIGPATEKRWRDTMAFSGTRMGPVRELLLSERRVIATTVSVESGPGRTREFAGFMVPGGVIGTDRDLIGTDRDEFSRPDHGRSGGLIGTVGGSPPRRGGAPPCPDQPPSPFDDSDEDLDGADRDNFGLEEVD